MEVICLEEAAFRNLLDRVIDQVKERVGEKEPTWLSSSEAMALMHIKSKTTMQALRDQSKVTFTQPTPRHILYNRKSVLAYLESQSQNSF